MNNYDTRSYAETVEIARKICSNPYIGNGENGVAYLAMVEMVYGATLNGQENHNNKLLFGASQLSQGVIQEIRCSHLPKIANARIILHRMFGIDMSNCLSEDLDGSIELCLSYTRMFLMTITHPIPMTQEERAHYIVRYTTGGNDTAARRLLERLERMNEERFEYDLKIVDAARRKEEKNAK